MVARFGDPEDYRYAFILGRAYKKLKAGKMAEEAGIDPNRYSDYEKGVRVPSLKTRKRIVKAWGVDDVAFLDEWLVPLCRTLHLGFARAAGEPESEALPSDGAPAQLSGIAASAVEEAVSPFALELANSGTGQHVPSSKDLSWAAELWRRLEPLEAEDQTLIVRILQDGRSWALAELLCLESEGVAGSRPGEAVRLAQLALMTAEMTPGPAERRLHLLARCHDFVANATRAKGDHAAAAEIFAQSDKLWNHCEASDLQGLLEDTRRLDLRASLIMNQERPAEALDLLDSALEASCAPAARARLLAKKAIALGTAGRFERSLEVLREMEPLLETQISPAILLSHRFELAVNFCHLGHYTEAELLLPQIHALTKNKRASSIRLRWLEGRIWLGLGRREDAVAALSEVRQYFQSEKIDYDFALVTLELAVLHLEEGRTQLVRTLAEEMFWIFERQKVHKEALAALTLFRRAADIEEARAEWTRRLIQYLYRAQHNPGMRFET